MAPHSSTLAWKIPWAEEPGGLQSVGSQRVGHDWVTSLSLFTFMSMGSHRVRHDWNGLAAAAAAAAAAGLYKKRDTDQIFLPLKFWKDICIYMLLLFSHVWLFVTPWTVALQAPLSMGFPRQEYWSGLPFSSPGHLPHPGIKPASPELAGRFATTEPGGKPTHTHPPTPNPPHTYTQGNSHHVVSSLL